MAVKIGIVGRGFMGSMHLGAYASIPGAEVVAVCDTDQKKLKADASAAGNIAVSSAQTDWDKVTWYPSLDAMLKNPAIDVVDITLPTYLHADAVVKAFGAGKHVICEKPMALTSKDAKRMIDAAKKAHKRLFVGHCIRYWPAYAKAREMVQSGKYGKVVSARFVRLSLTPVWSWDNWLLDAKRSGGAALDLHIHDSDFVLYTFGAPKAVVSHGTGLKQGRIDHIVTAYEYGDGKLVTAEGSWVYAAGFGFQMQFAIALEKATLMCGPDLKLMIHPVKGKSSSVRVSKLDGYTLELRDFIACVRKDKFSDVVPPQSALQSVKLLEAEMNSVQTGKRVAVKL